MTNQLILSEKKLFDQQKLIPITALTIGTVAISFAAILIKWSEVEISANATIFNRFWIAGIILGFWNSFNFIYLKQSNPQSPQESPENKPYTKTVIILLLVALGAIDMVCQTLWAWSMTKTSIAISTVLLNLTPIFTTLIAWLFFNKRFELKFLLGMIIAIAAMFVLALEDLQMANGKISGDLAALLSAVFYGAYLLIIEQLRPQLSATQILMWSSLSGAILTIPVLILTGEKLFPSSSSGWLTVISLGIICQALGQGLITYSFKNLSSGFIALFLILEPVLSAIEAWIIFSEKLVLLDWIAFTLVLIGIYLALSSESSSQQIVESTEAQGA